jgi:hypothetical protein
MINEKDKDKLLALGSVAIRADIPSYRLARWFYGQTNLTAYELERLLNSLKTAQVRADNMVERVRKEIKNK